MRILQVILVLYICFCESLFSLDNSESFGRINPLETLNSEFDDFAPSYDAFRNMLYFNSVRDGFSYFYSSKFENDTLALPQLMKGGINKKNKNQMYIRLINEDLALYSAYSLKNDRSFINLFLLYYKKGNWTNPVLLDSIASSNYSSQAVSSANADFIIFSTVRNAKETDTDLWIAYRQSDGSYNDLMPLNNLNSPGNEITPFLVSDDTLYFASDGLGGPGGYDIYRSVKIDGVWQRPFPITDLNTEFDESDFIFVNDNLCLFASNRPGGKGGMDLYSAECFRRTEIKIDDTEFDISLTSTIHLVKVENLVNVSYLYDKKLLECRRETTFKRSFSPDFVDLQFFTKPEGSFANAKMKFETDDGEVIRTISIDSSKADFRLNLQDILANNNKITSLIINVTAISKANFSISKNVEINFSERETVNAKPEVIENENYGLLRITCEDFSEESCKKIIDFFDSENAVTLRILYPKSFQKNISELSRQLSKNNNFNFKIFESDEVDSIIKIYFK